MTGCFIAPSGRSAVHHADSAEQPASAEDSARHCQDALHPIFQCLCGEHLAFWAVCELACLGHWSDL